MTELYLEKFPVTSHNGMEYLVTVQEDRNDVRYVDVRLYEKIGKKNIFGKEKLRFLNRGFMGYGSLYDEKKWDYDYIAMATNEVKDYEQRIMNQINANAKKIANELKFQKWDGNIE